MFNDNNKLYNNFTQKDLEKNLFTYLFRFTEFYFKFHLSHYFIIVPHNVNLEWKKKRREYF